MDNEDRPEPKRAPKSAEVQPPAAAPAPEAPAAPKRTPADWAKVLEFSKPADPRLPQSEPHTDWQHAAADVLHGWSRHAYHYQADPFEISEADYRAALEAGANHPPTPAHAAAIATLTRKEPG